MSHRLGKKLSAGTVRPIPPSEAPEAPSKAVKQRCFERDNGNNAMCSYRTVEGTTWVFPVKHFVAAHNADDGATMQVIYTGAEVFLRGSNLDRIRKAIARGHAFVVRAVNTAFKSEYKEEVFVSLVRVVETKPARGVPDEPDEP